MLNIKESPEQHSYFNDRMKLLGVTPEINKIALWKNIVTDGIGELKLVDEPIFKSVELGIDIIVYTLGREQITYKADGNRFSKYFAITRLKDPVEKNGQVMKYRLPKGAGTYPFFPPQLIEKFEKKIPMKTVFITEGYFKAFKGAMAGLDIIGLSSITHMKDKVSGSLHDDILTLVKSGLVERMVWLTDGDCLDITAKEITDDKDLYTRPAGFFNSITTFRNLLDDYSHIEKWFAHIDTDGIIADDKTITRDQVKGLDDLLITFPDKQAEIVQDLLSVSRSGFYFKKLNIDRGVNNVRKYFHLMDVNDFFFFHCDRRPELKTKEFKYLGTRYAFDEAKNACEVKMPGEADNYFRVGDNYYKFIEKPNQYKKIENVIASRAKTTLVDDHGKHFIKHVQKYEDFCNVPDHDNFEQVIHGCFNVYSPLDHKPEEEQCTEEDCPNVINLIKHIWGGKTVHYKNKDTGIKYEYKSWELGMDYMQLLYQQPAQKMPILCPVSRENNTGKSTLGFFLREMLGANVAIVGNQDIASDFNAHWSTKSVVVIDEAKIDKVTVVEKIKMLSTARKIFMNAKGRGQVELDCFIKFVLITNNEENFITASEDDIRYWVIKVPVLTNENPDMLAKLVDEIPAFLSLLNGRKLATERMSRMWFHKDLLQTDALKKVIEYSAPVIVKDMRTKLKELFLITGDEEIFMTPSIIIKELITKKQTEETYVIKVLKEHMKAQPYHVWVVEGKEVEYKDEETAVAVAEALFSTFKGPMIYSKISRKYKPTRFKYPTPIEVFKDGIKETSWGFATATGRPYVFKRKNYVTTDEENENELGPEAKLLALKGGQNIMSSDELIVQPTGTIEELPF